MTLAEEKSDDVFCIMAHVREITSNDEPSTIREALRGPDAYNWRTSMEDERDMQEEKQEDSSSSDITAKRMQSDNGLRRSNHLAQRQRRDYLQVNTG